jgi:diphosphomevalonate decarboxylase
MSMIKATAISCANIAFIKYWGRKNHELRLPLNSSISMNLDSATTTTTVVFGPGLGADQVTIEGTDTGEKAARRVSEHLDRIRALAGINAFARVVSRNSFPMGAGIASSASAFAALTVAACAAAGLSLEERALTILARQGSGSACRSIPAGFVEWHTADTDEGSYAEQIAPPDHWDLRDLIAIVQTGHKKVGSTRGHELVDPSPFADARLAAAERALPIVREALLARDFVTFGEETEQEAIRMHAVAMTSQPSLLYWSPDTVRIMHAVRDWREDGLAAYFTIDAGANVHVLGRGADARELEDRMRGLPGVQDVLANRPGPGTHLVSEHLF